MSYKLKAKRLNLKNGQNSYNSSSDMFIKKRSPFELRTINMLISLLTNANEGKAITIEDSDLAAKNVVED